MSRRGRSGPAISLFAFQDIITSVTAIVIVVVLFLALDLVQRKESARADSPVGVAADLTDRIAELKRELVCSPRRPRPTPPSANWPSFPRLNCRRKSPRQNACCKTCRPVGRN